MWPFKKDKFKNLKREDVVDAICELEKQEADIEKSIEEMAKQIDALMQKGKMEKTHDLKVFYVKKISFFKYCCHKSKCGFSVSKPINFNIVISISYHLVN